MTLELVGRDADAQFYLQRTSAQPGPVLVLGGGTGKVAWALAASGLRVVSVDPSAAMVDEAEQRRPGAPPEVSARLSLQVADLRSLRLSERFPWVIAPQNALGLMATSADLDAVLATVRHHLAPSGFLLFDVLNPPGFRAPPRPGDEAPSAPLPPMHPVFVPHLRERRAEGARASGGLHRLRLRQFSPEELDAALSRTGLDALERYGDFEGKPFSPEDPIQVVVAAALGNDAPV